MSRQDNDDDGDVGHVAIDFDTSVGHDDDATESSPLLHQTPDLPERVIDKSLRRRVLLIIGVVLLVVEMCEFLMNPPTQQIMEDIICRQQFPDHKLFLPQVQDDRCKGSPVQKPLAMVRSWGVSADMFVPMFVQIPWGIVADKYGRRPVMFLSLFGILLKNAWTLVVFSYPDTFSVWATLWGSVTYLIGGGGQMALAMLFTILADIIPVEERTGIFYQLMAFILILSVIFTPLTALLLNLDPWLPLWIGFGCLALATMLSLLMPETLDLTRQADIQRRRQQADQRRTNHGSPDSVKRSVLQQTWFTAKNDMTHIWRFIFGSKSIVLLIAAYGIFTSVKASLSIEVLQYMTKRFHWSWSKATYVSTVSSLTAVVVLLVFLPLASPFLVKRFKFSSVSRDFFLIRVSIVLVTFGAFLAAISAKPWQLISSLIIFSLGVGFNSQCRAILNALVEPHTVATLNTAISTVESITMGIASPAMGWLLGRGMDIGGFWMGLPFMVTFIAALTGGIILFFFFKLPKSMV